MTALPHPRVGSAAARAARLGALRNGARGKRVAVFHPTSGARRPGDQAALVGGVGWMTAPPHPRVGSPAARGRQARCLTQRGAWKTLRGFPPYIRRPPPGRSGGACGGRRVDDGAASSTRGVGGCEGPPGSMPYATGRVENALRFSTLHPAPAAREIRRACWVFGRRVDDGAASSTRGVGCCEGPPGSVPYATGRVENASRVSTLRSRRWPRARLLTSPAPPSCPAGGGRSPCGNRCRSLRRWPGRWSGTWLHADSGE